MTLRHLKIFLTICETGNMTRASEALYLTQPAVSYAIAEMEKHYGVKLFDRINKKIYLTETGKKLKEYSKHLLDTFDVFEKDIKEWGSSGTLRIGSSVTIGNCFLPKYVKSFTKNHPNTKVKVNIANTRDIVNLVLDNSIDLALIEGITSDSNIMSKNLFSDTLNFICSNNCNLAGKKNIPFESIADKDFIVREKGSAGRDVIDGIMAVHGYDFDPLWETISTQSIINAVKDDIGISFLPATLTDKAVLANEIATFTVSKISVNRDLKIIWHKQKHLSKSIQDFLAICEIPIIDLDS